MKSLVSSWLFLSICLVNIPLIKAMEQMSSYAKFIKDLVNKRRIVNYELVDNVHHYSTTAIRMFVQKKSYPGAFIIPFTIGVFSFSKAICDLGVRINLIPLAIYE